MQRNLGFHRSAVVIVGLFMTLGAQAQIEPSTSAAEADWARRTSASNVFYSNHFSSYTDSADLRAQSNSLTHDAGMREVLLSTTRAISGGKSLDIRTYSTAGANGGAWGDVYLDGATVNDFFFQIALYLPRETIGWRSKGGDGQLKLVNLERYGSGQVVIHHNKFLGFPTVMTNGAGVVQRYLDNIPYRSNDWFYQNAIDSGSSLNAGTQEAYWRRYGPARSIQLANSFGYIDNDANANFLYNRGFSWPDANALASGAVPWNLDGWTVIEVYIHTQDGGPQELKMWAAAYGQPPTLVSDINAPSSDLSQSPSYQPDLYKRFELLNYETPREAEPNYRPILDTYFDEVIASYDAIRFPGDFSLDVNRPSRPDPPGSLQAAP